MKQKKPVMIIRPKISLEKRDREMFHTDSKHTAEKFHPHRHMEMFHTRMPFIGGVCYPVLGNLPKK